MTIKQVYSVWGRHNNSPFSSRYAHQDYVDLLVKIVSILAARWLMAEIS